MKTRYYALAAAAFALLVSCNTKEDAFSLSGDNSNKKINIGTLVGDPLTKAVFDNASAPEKYICWEADDNFDFHAISLGKDLEGKDAETVELSSSVPDKLSSDGKTAFFSKDASDFLVITYPAGAVELMDSVVNVKSTTYKPSTKQIVKATVPSVQPLSSVLSPDLVPMTSAKLAVSEAAAAFDKEAGVAFSTPVAMYPLAGIVKMSLKGLTDVTSGKVVKVSLLSEFAGKAKDPSYGISGSQAFSLAAENGVPTLSTLSEFISGSNDYKGDADRLRINLESSAGLDYSADKGCDVCFIVNHSSSGMKTVRVSVYMADGSVYQKKFTLTDNVGFNKARVSVFALDFSTGSEVRTADSVFGVEWSEGYLVYDAENSAYKFGAADQPGLYFKFGSPLGVEFYPSSDDYIYRLKPADANVVQSVVIGGVERQIGLMTPDGQTGNNGSCYFFTNNAPSSGVVAAWRNRAYFAPGTEGKIVADTLRAHTEYQFKTSNAASSAFEGASDPCSYVKVAAGENKWRVPSADEVNDLIEKGAVGVEYLNSDGSFPTGNYDAKLKQARYADGTRTLVFSAFGSVPETYAKDNVYKLQMLYSNKYAVRFWTSKYASQKGTAYNLSLSSAPTYTTKASTSTYNSGSTNSYVAEGCTIGEALPVRCVRDKKNN
ncbi:MAG: hypothetical protein K6F21_03330 [Bacteroidales bacterium]|nr:hypothetical protein [Bacteroidales bacterium]